MMETEANGELQLGIPEVKEECYLHASSVSSWHGERK